MPSRLSSPASSVSDVECVRSIVMILAAGGAMVGVSVYYMRFMRPSQSHPRIVDVGSMAGPRYSRCAAGMPAGLNAQ